MNNYCFKEDLVIGILYICTGKYDVFWKGFYHSCEKYFLPGVKKKYFVFTDAVNIFGEDNDCVIKIYQDNLGWPGNTLFRYNMFRKHMSMFSQCDYLYFFNANIVFLKEIGMEILPENEEDIVVVQHPGFFNKSNRQYSYDRNPDSLAYIPMGEGNYYICGGINGGTQKSFCRMISVLAENIDVDFSKDIIAIWHDESHINHYIYNMTAFKMMNCDYAYPEDWEIPFDSKILILDKTKFGGHDYLRNK